MLLKKLFELNPNQLKSIKPLVIVLFNSSEGSKSEDAFSYTDTLKNIYGVPKDWIHRLDVNGEELHDSVEWSRFNRPLFHFNYQLKTSDPVRIIRYEAIGEMQ